jgi:hypothetical protein
MKNSKPLTILLATIMLLGFVPGITLVHAVGQLYISPTTQGPFAKGATFTYQVKVANIDPFNGWDISVKTDPAVISPTSISVTGNMLAVNFSSTVKELINCVNNVGTNCTASDGAGIAHSLATVQGPVPMTKPTSGLLFTITYTVVASGSSTVHLFNDLLFNGSPFPVPHTTSDGFYGAPADFTISASPLSASITQGQTTTSSITVTSANGFSGMVSLSASASPSLTNGPTVTVDPSVTITATTPGTATLTIVTTSNTPFGSYTITVTGTSGSASHTATFLLDLTALTAPDFTVFVTPTFLPTVLASYPSCCATVNVTSLNGFSGTVMLTQNVSPVVKNAPFASFSTSTVTLSAGQTVLVAATINSFALTPTPAPSPKKVYTIEIVGTSGTLTHAGLAIVNVQPAVFQRGRINFLREVSLTKDSGIQTVSVKVQNNATSDVLGQLIVKVADPSDPTCKGTFISTPITLPHGNVLANIGGVQVDMSVTFDLAHISASCLPVGDVLTIRAFVTFSGSVLPSGQFNGLGGTLTPIVGSNPLRVATGATGHGAVSGGLTKQDRGTFDVVP